MTDTEGTLNGFVYDGYQIEDDGRGVIITDVDGYWGEMYLPDSVLGVLALVAVKRAVEEET